MPEKLVRMYHTARSICFPKPKTWSGQQKKGKTQTTFLGQGISKKESCFYIKKKKKLPAFEFCLPKKKRVKERKCYPRNKYRSLKKRNERCAFHLNWLYRALEQRPLSTSSLLWP